MSIPPNRTMHGKSNALLLKILLRRESVTISSPEFTNGETPTYEMKMYSTQT